MSDLAWAVKNGDLDQVKEMVDVKVGDGVPGDVCWSVCAGGGC